MSENQRKTPSLLLFLLCVAGGGALYLQTESRLVPPPEFPEPVVEPRQVAMEPLALNVAFAPLASFEEIIERPLFAETRSPPPPKMPPPPDAPPPPPPPERDLFTLLGVATSGENRVAIVRVKKTGEISQVGVGDQLGGWYVTEISPRSVLFMNGKYENLVELQDLTAPPPAPHAPPPSAKGPPRRGLPPPNPAPAVSPVPPPRGSPPPVPAPAASPAPPPPPSRGGVPR